VDRSGPAPGRSRNVRRALSRAVGLAGERPVDASVVLLAALMVGHEYEGTGVTSALLGSLSNRQPDPNDPEDLLERLGRAIGIAVTGKPASLQVVASRTAVAPLAPLLRSAAQVATRVSGDSYVHLRHLVAAAVLATEPPL